MAELKIWPLDWTMNWILDYDNCFVCYSVATKGVGIHYEGHKCVIDEVKMLMFFHKSSVVLHYLLKNLLQRQASLHVYKLSLYIAIYKSNVILIDKSSKDSVFIMGRYLCKYIFIMCLITPSTVL